ncbi:aminoglycoside phosphotransferase [Marinobacter sp. C1S70]|uniref:Aminoglycoside phosphotransferase n=1 Tax=Marinobacter nauticus (strain ATCC 700491 / DSM 11845 / VT8) TaxID=351348 RepID=A1U6G2_MARN8|nr:MULTISPECIES: phosphotransferase [Marinobacter]ABM20581.1 aminoglycoside phosphotransferase [Marinobacter nauticus VT8]ERS83154.1 aminoglycoside phosphotransferase [Marinobacter sp. C1S70]
MDNRLQLLTRWVRQIPGFSAASPTPVSGDASFRRYFRVWKDVPGGQLAPFIVMDAPPEHEDCVPFVAIARHWHQHGIAVPAIAAEDLEQGFLLLEDLGNLLMLTALEQGDVDTLYRAALDELARIAGLDDPADYPLPAYDQALLDREMALFPDWLLEKHLGLELDNQERALLDTAFGLLRESALAQPEVTVHRDYHSRNLLVRDSQTVPGVIDFQDAVRGPITYDAVSLLKDCYVRWPEQRLASWLEHFRNASQQAGLHRADADTFRQWFELMGMQRHLKAAGIFARLAIRDGKTGYLADIPRTVSYLRDASARQPAFRHFHEWLCSTVIPAIEQRIGPLPEPGVR